MLILLIQHLKAAEELSTHADAVVVHEVALEIGAFKNGSLVNFIADAKSNFVRELIEFLFDFPDLVQCLPVIDGNPQ